MQFRKKCLSIVLAFAMALGVVQYNMFDTTSFARESEVRNAEGNGGYKKPAPVLEGEDKKGTPIMDGTGRPKRQENAIHVSYKGITGRAFTMTGFDFSTAINEDPLPDGIIIYLQWMDADGAISPIYSTTTYTTDRGQSGWYGFGKDKITFKDALGNTHEPDFRANNRRKYRIWVPEGQYSPAGNEYVTTRQAPGGQVGFYGPTQSAGGAFVLVGSNISKTGVFVYEMPKVELMTAKKETAPFKDANGNSYWKYKIDKEGPLKRLELILPRPNNTVSGAIWWETKEGGVTFPKSTGEPRVEQNTIEDGLKGIRVITSALSPEGIAAMKSITKKVGAKNRVNMMEEILREHPEYIMQTVEAPVVMSKDGNISRYAARFDAKINREYLYQFVVGPNNEVLNVINKYPIPGFYHFNDYNGGGPAFAPPNGLYNVHHALVSNPYESTIDVTNYGMDLESSARPGDKAKVSVKATFLPGHKTEIVWVNSMGTVLKTDRPSNLKEANEATFLVPDDTEKDIITAQLVIDGTIVDADQFLVDANPKLRLHRNLNEDDKTVKVESIKGKDPKEVSLPRLADTKDYKIKDKYFVGWSTNPKATEPDENKLINKDELGIKSTVDIYVRDGINYKIEEQGKNIDLYGVWKDPFTVSLSKKWIDAKKAALDAKGYDTSKLKFGLFSRSAVGTFGNEVVAEVATYEPVTDAEPKAYDPNDQDGIKWTNLPSYDEKGRRISYISVELTSDEMVEAYENGDADWDTYNINIIPEVNSPVFIPRHKEQSVQIKKAQGEDVDAFTSATHRVHLVGTDEKDPHPLDGSQGEKIGYFDTNGYKIGIQNIKMEVSTPKIEQAKKNETELTVNVDKKVDGLNLVFTPVGKTPVNINATLGADNKWKISPVAGYTVDEAKSTDKKLVLKTTDPLKAGDVLTAEATLKGAKSSKDTMTVIDNESRLPKEIHQVRSEDNDKIKIEAKPYEELVNGSYITVVPSSTKYELVDENGDKIAGTEAVEANGTIITFEVPKANLTEGKDVFIKVTEPGKDPSTTSSVETENTKPETAISTGGKLSNRGVKVDITAPDVKDGVLPEITGFVGNPIKGKTFEIIEDNGFKIKTKLGPIGTDIEINQAAKTGTIKGTPQSGFDGETKIVVEDMFGNSRVIKGSAKIYEKIVDKIPNGLDDKYYPITFKADDHSALVVNYKETSEVVKYALKDFNGDKTVDAKDNITLDEAKNMGLLVPSYKVKDNRYEIASPAWKPDINEGGFKFGPNETENNTVVLQTKEVENIVPVPKPDEKGIPEGYVRITLDKDDTVKFAANAVTTYDVKKDANVRYADVYSEVKAEPASADYKDVKWYKADKVINGSDVIKETETITAKATNAKNIIPVEDINTPVPAGYVRVTISKGDKIKTLDGTVTYDVKKDGSVRYSDIIAEATKTGSNTNIVIDDAKGRKPFVWTIGKQVAEGKQQTVKKGEEPNARYSIENREQLPDGTKFEYIDENGDKTTPNTDTVGTTSVKVKVTYPEPDKTTEIVVTTIKVVDKELYYYVNDLSHPVFEGCVRIVFQDNATVSYNEGNGIRAIDLKIDSQLTYNDIVELAQADPASGYKNPIIWSRDSQVVNLTDKILKDTDAVGTKITLTPKATAGNPTKINPNVKGVPVEPSAYPTVNTKLTVDATALDKDTYAPAPVEQTVKQTEVPKAENSIGNKDKLPEGTKYEFVDENGKITTPDTKATGTNEVTIKVTYPDKTTETVKTNIKVVPKDEIIDVADPNSKVPDGYVRFKFADDPSVTYLAQNRVVAVDVKLGSDARYADITKRAEATPAENYKEPIDWYVTSNFNTTGVKVRPEEKVISTSQRSKQVITLRPEATKVDASIYNPAAQVQKVVQDETPEAKNSIGNRDEMPIDTTYKFVKVDGEKVTDETPKTDKVGEVPVKVLVTFPDKSTKLVETTITVLPKDAIIDITNKPNAPNPEGYVKVTLVNDETSVETFKKVYQVKSDGSVRYADLFTKAGTLQPKDGYKEPITWKDGQTVIKGTEKPEDAKTITAYATETDAKKIGKLKTKEQTVTKGEQPVAERSILDTNAHPQGTTYQYVDNAGSPLTTVETSTVGSKDVIVKANFPDGSSLTSEANIIVEEKLDNIIPVPNPGEKETPEGYVRITLDKDATVKFAAGVATTYDVKKDANVRYADVYSKVKAEPASNDYKDVKWYKEDNSVVDPAGKIATTETITAKATNAKDIIPVDDPNSEVPAGYVRVTLDKDNTVTFKEDDKTVYDVKLGANISINDVAKEVEATPTAGHKDVTWYNGSAKLALTDKVDKLIDGKTGEDAKKATITAKAAKEDAKKSDAPTVNPVGKDDDKITGKGTKDAVITVVDKDGNPIKGKDNKPITATVKDDGTWEIPKDKLPDGKTPTDVYVNQTEKDKTPSDAVKVPSKDKSSEPSVNPVGKDDDKITGKGTKGAVITVVDQDGNPINGKDNKPITTTVKDDGTWEIPKDKLPDDKNPTDIYVNQKDGDKDSSEPVPVEAKKLSDEYKVSYDTVRGIKGKEFTSKAPKFTNNKGEDQTIPNDTTFDIPQEWKDKGATIDPNTGVVKYTVPENETENVISIPVIVNYNDGSKGSALLLVSVTEDDKTDSGTPTIDPVKETDKKVTVKVPQGTNGDVVVTFPGKDGNTIVVGPAKPDNNGNVVVDVPENADMTPGKDIAATYTEEDKNPTTTKQEISRVDDSDKYDPQPKNIDVKVGETPKAKDGIINTKDLPTNTTYEFVDNEGKTVKPDTTKVGTIPVTIKVTYPDGTSDSVNTNIVVTKPSSGGSGGSGTYTPTPTPNKPDNGGRVSGNDRIETAIEISRKYFSKADTVIIVRHDLFPDSMTASVLSKLLKAPILLTKTDALDNRVKEEIRRLGAKEMIIVGGETSVSNAVREALKEFDSDKNVERIAGRDRYATSEAVARRVVGITGKKHQAVIASGEVFPDALSVGPFAAREGLPILLVKKDIVTNPVQKVVKDLEINSVYIAGGLGTVSSKAESMLPKTLERMSGRDRYETAVAIAKSKFAKSEEAFIANGEVFADALVISPVGGLRNQPILLVKKDQAPKSVIDYVQNSELAKVVAIGGRSLLPDSIIDQLLKK